MKLVHFESGLGNQMLNYAEYLAIKESNPDDDIYMENIIYEFPEVNKVICQWNGYELKRIFSLDIPNIRSRFHDEKWYKIVDEVRNSEFWIHNWNYPNAILPALEKSGLKFINRCTPRFTNERSGVKKILFSLKNANPIAGNIKLAIKRHNNDRYLYEKRKPENLFIQSTENLYCGQTGLFMFAGNEIERIESKLKTDFVFPVIKDKRNKEIMERILSTNSVSIHARRGDALSSSGYYYKSGYFKRSVRYIKEKIDRPVFFFFSDPGSIDWCKNNLHLFGLVKSDRMYFVDWNKGDDSYVDMQLMSMCKHNIITYSSFGWWASFLNNNSEKITCSPYYCMNTTHHF